LVMYAYKIGYHHPARNTYGFRVAPVSNYTLYDLKGSISCYVRYLSKISLASEAVDQIL
jgi:hypothetical protein